MTLEQQVQNALVSDPAVNAIIGTRLYLLQLPQNPVYPAAVYQRVSTVPIYSHSPATGQQASVGWARFSITGWATGANSGAIMEAFAAAVLAALQTFNAWALPTSPQVITQSPNYIVGRRMSIEPQTDPPLFMAAIDVRICYRDQ
jgi:hypothetical protein